MLLGPRRKGTRRVHVFASAKPAKMRKPYDGIYSLIESAKLAGLEPRAYLGEAARRTIRSPGAVTLARDLK